MKILSRLAFAVCILFSQIGYAQSCFVNGFVTASPLPSGGTYSAGQTVTFCFTITEWQQTNTNWLHGMYPIFGNGWDTSTLIHNSPASSCDTFGHWGWYNADTSVATGVIWPAGYYYASSVPNGAGLPPGHGYGDGDITNSPSCGWQFCLTIKTSQTLTAASDLSIAFHTTGDGQSGVWQSLACSNDTPIVFNPANGACSYTHVSINASPDTLQYPGSSYLTATGAPAGGTYQWSPTAGLTPSNGTSATEIATPSSATTYRVIYNVSGCADTAYQSIYVLSLYAGPDQSICINTTATMAATGSGTWTALASNPANTTTSAVAIADTTNPSTAISGFPTRGHYGFIWTTQWGSDTVYVQVNGLLVTAGADRNICPAGSLTYMGGTPTVSSGGSGHYSYRWSPVTDIAVADTAVANPHATPHATRTYTVYVTDSVTGCIASDSLTVTVGARVQIYVSPDSIMTVGDSVSLSGVGFPTASGVQWSWAPLIRMSPAAGDTATVSVFPQTTQAYCATYTVNGCQATSCQTIHVVPAYAGPDQTICQDTAAIMAGHGSGNWSAFLTNPASTFITNTASATAVITGFTVAGDYGFIWTTTAGADTMIVHVNTPSSVSFVAYPDTVVTVSHSQVLVATGIPAGGSYSWSPSIDISPYPFTDTAFTNPSFNITRCVYYTAGGCSSTYCRPLTVRGVSAGADQTICEYTTTTLAATDGGIWSNPVWSIGQVIFADPRDPHTSVSGFISSGVYTLIWTDTVSTITDTVLIHVIAKPNAGADMVVCQSGTATMAAAGTGVWSAVAGNPGTATVATSTSATTTISGFTQIGTYVYIWTVNGCTDSVNVIVTSGMQLSDSVINASCGQNNGEICVRANGRAPYFYAWSNGVNGSTSTTTCINNLSLGHYSVTVADANNCSAGLTDSIRAVLLTVADSVTGVSCFGAGDGQICLHVTGGTGVYTYVWSPVVNPGACATNLGPGQYRVTVSDGNGCASSASIIINQPPVLSISVVSLTNVSCYGDSNGTTIVMATGGTGPYTYHWQDGFIGSTHNQLSAGIYCVTAIDANGCTASTCMTITQPASAFSVTESHVDVLCHSGATGSITLTLAGGSVPYTVSWTATLSGPVITNLTAGNYLYTATDGNGCVVNDSVYVGETPAIIVTDSIHNVSCSGTNDGSINVFVSGGSGGYNYQWITTPFTATSYLTGIPAGTYTIEITDANNCHVQHSSSVLFGHDCIWPGDADANLIVDNNDLLPIGLAYDSTGAMRPGASIVWIGQACPDWRDTFATGVNYKYADCNGDGVVDANDTVAITQNFGLIHAKTNGVSRAWRSGQPVIYPTLSNDTVTNGDTLVITINLGQLSLTASNVYGLAFNLNYDAAVVDTTKTAMVFGNSWLGNASDKISLYKDVKTQGVIKAAVTRIDHTTRSGQGPIAFVRAIVTTDNIDGKDLSYYTFRCSITDVTAIDAAGHVIGVNEGTDSNQVAFTPLGVTDISVVSSQISLYPNPTNSIITIASGKVHVDGATVQNVLGETVLSYTYTDSKTEHTLELQGLSSGIYYIAVKTKAGTITKKVVLSY